MCMSLPSVILIKSTRCGLILTCVLLANVFGCDTYPRVSGTWTGTLDKTTLTTHKCRPFDAYTVQLESGPRKFNRGAKLSRPDIRNFEGHSPVVITPEKTLWRPKHLKEGDKVRVRGTLSWHSVYVYVDPPSGRGGQAPPDAGAFGIVLSRPVERIRKQ
jgi:hypothetical protein